MARHGSLAEQLDGFRNFVTEPDHKPEPIETNWDVVPSDIAMMSVDFEKNAERYIETYPSIDEIARNVNQHKPERNAAGQIVKWGKLRFSDGTQTEKAFKVTVDGKVEQYDARVPTGALMGSVEKSRDMRGGVNPEDVRRSNEYFCEIFDVEFRPRQKASKKLPKRQQTTKDADKEILKQAYENTDWSVVSIQKCPDGLPSWGNAISENFLGCRKTTCAGNGSQSWQDIVVQSDNRDEWLRSLEMMADDHFEMLTIAAKSSSLRAVGEARGYSGKYAIAAGRRLLIAADNDLKKAMELVKYAKEKR